MNIRIKQLRDLVVALDRYDQKLDVVDGKVYQAAAVSALALTHDEMGLLPMTDFAGPVNALQTMAENIHFIVNGRFADLDGTGRADEAKTVAAALFYRMCEAPAGGIQELSNSLMVRLCTGVPGTTRSARHRGRAA